MNKSRLISGRKYWGFLGKQKLQDFISEGSRIDKQSKDAFLKNKWGLSTTRMVNKVWELPNGRNLTNQEAFEWSGRSYGFPSYYPTETTKGFYIAV